MPIEWNTLTTVQFQQQMKPAALRIYRRLFPGSVLQDLREQGVKVHVLDKEFGIDALLVFQSGQWISIQEKYRKADALRYMDFTQEYKNAVGTAHEADGEWFHLGAQLYFYGWANEACSIFTHWLLLDVARYKALVERLGGLGAIGRLHQNSRHGRANFYAIPIARLSAAIMVTNIADIGAKNVLKDTIGLEKAG